MRLSKTLVGVLLCAYFLMLILTTAPAELGVAIFKKVVPNAQLSGISGTLWSGRAETGTVQVKSMTITTDVFRWDVDVWSILTLKMCVNFKSDKISGNVCRSISGLNLLSGLSLELPASLANNFTQMARFSGFTRLDVDNAALNDKGVIDALKGQFVWTSATVSVSGMTFSLGDYAAELSPSGKGGAKFRIFDTNAPIKVNLQAELNAGETPRVSGEVIPGPSAPAQINDALSLYAIPRDEGGFTLTYPMGG